MKTKLSSVLFFAVFFIFSCEKEVAILEPCEGDMQFDTLQAFASSQDFLPYDYTFEKRLVFKNEAGEELIFSPARPTPKIEVYTYGTTYACSDGTRPYIEYSAKAELYPYRSSQDIQLLFSIEPKLQEMDGGFAFYDALSVSVVLFGDDVLDTRLHRMDIPTSFRDQEAFETNSIFNFQEVFASKDIGGRTYPEVYIGQVEGNQQLAYSPAAGLLEFKDVEGTTWTFDRIETQSTEQAFDFQLPDQNGDMVQLSEIEADLIIIDFWASWCVPCREENVEVLNPLYAQFQSQGLEIVSLSIDEEKAPWLAAIATDNMSWINVNDENGWNTDLRNYYEVYGIPTTYLIDPDLNVVAKNLRGEALVEFVENYLE
ncbi:MAG: TlpA family protein disulfide reductase [Saprospiraceae bacterium]|nr:TlpA family protein disulfide reductase [Saprospiraceae bacterium]